VAEGQQLPALAVPQQGRISGQDDGPGGTFPPLDVLGTPLRGGQQGVRFGRGPIGIEADGAMLHERARGEIHVEVRPRNQRIDDVQRELRLGLDECREGDTWGRAHQVLHVRGQRRWNAGTTAVVIQKDQIPDGLRGQFHGRPYPVAEPQACCSLLARRTTPLATLIAHVAMRLRARELLELLLFLPLFQPGPLVCQHQEIRRVRDGQGPSRAGWVAQAHGRGLIVVLQDSGVMFHRIDGPQFDGVAFKLDGASHLARGIGATDIGAARLHTPRRGEERTRVRSSHMAGDRRRRRHQD
jgi:hypothetical protein